ncbi:hypothetical protein B0H13DRAFT_1869958 [Mycena leptocephala]|nr:hypothetical protein B0H13DRAFT_1869958 [Mycena leptocephala]
MSGLHARSGCSVLRVDLFAVHSVSHCACMRFAPPHLFAFAVHRRLTLCMRVAPPVHKFVTRTPALDDAHQSVDTLGMLLRRGRFVLAGSVLSACVETLVDRRKLGVTDGSGEEKGNGGSETVYDGVAASPGCLAGVDVEKNESYLDRGSGLALKAEEVAN